MPRAYIEASWDTVQPPLDTVQLVELAAGSSYDGRTVAVWQIFLGSYGKIYRHWQTRGGESIRWEGYVAP